MQMSKKINAEEEFPFIFYFLFFAKRTRSHLIISVVFCCYKCSINTGIILLAAEKCSDFHRVYSSVLDFNFHP